MAPRYFCPIYSKLMVSIQYKYWGSLDNNKQIYEIYQAKDFFSRYKFFNNYKLYWEEATCLSLDHKILSGNNRICQITIKEAEEFVNNLYFERMSQ